MYTKKLSVLIAFLFTAISYTNHGMEKQSNDALLNAAKQNDCVMITKLLESGVDINSANADGITALMYAAMEGNTEAVQCLLNNSNIVIDQQDNRRGLTALMYAAQKNNCFIIQMLLNRGADINKSSYLNLTALMIAVLEKHQDVVQCLLNNFKIAINQKDKVTGNTALMLAVITNNCPIIQILLKHGADINEADVNGTTALILSIAIGSSDATQCLLNDPNIAINQQNNNGDTALLVAIATKNKLIIKQLLDAGADPEIANNVGLTSRNAAINNKLDAEILSLIHKAIIKKHGEVNFFSTSQK